MFYTPVTELRESSSNVSCVPCVEGQGGGKASDGNSIYGICDNGKAARISS